MWSWPPAARPRWGQADEEGPAVRAGFAQRWREEGQEGDREARGHSQLAAWPNITSWSTLGARASGKVFLSWMFEIPRPAYSD